MNCRRERYVSTNCRLCLHDDDILLDIFEKNENDEGTLADIICRLLDPQLSKDDGYPQVCCMECNKKLRAFQSMNCIESSPSFVLFREQCSIAKGVFDCTYDGYNEVQQHSPISENHSPLSLNLESYAILEDQKWHYDEILKAVAQILETMKAGELNSNQFPLETHTYKTEIESPPPQSPNENGYSRRRKTPVKRRIKSSVTETNYKKERKKAAIKSPRQSKSHNEKSQVQEKEGSGKHRFQCRTCGICCAGRHDLAKHNVVHTKDRPFPCSLCTKKFRHERNLKVHLKIHSGVKDLCCADCGKTFSNRSLLKSHMITHDPNKTFSCEECGKLFKRMSLLKLHMKVHSNVRPHKCKICGLTFIQHSDLTKHMPVHSGLREFSCSVCKKSFAHRRNLKAHERIHRKDEQFECVHCGDRWAQKGGLVMHLKKGCSMQRIRVKVL